MKRVFRLFAIIATITTLASCVDDTEMISETAQGYLDAMGNYKPTEARAFATKETCDSTLSFYEKIMENLPPESYANNIPATITLGEISKEDSTATVAFHKSTPSTQQDGSISLVKRDGKWLVQEVIKVPANVRFAASHDTTAVQGKRFTKEEIAEMRKNKAQHGPIPVKR